MLADFQSAGIIPVSADLLKMWFRGPQSMCSRGVEGQALSTCTCLDGSVSPVHLLV